MTVFILILLASALLLRQWWCWREPGRRLQRDVRHWHRSVTR